MGTMNSTLYLPDEVLNFVNYPETKDIAKDVGALIAYASKTTVALQAYTGGTSNRIDLSISELQKYVALCRSVCMIIGSAPNICYDLLVELREIQDVLQTLVHIKNRYGSQYIGNPTEEV